MYIISLNGEFLEDSYFSFTEAVYYFLKLHNAAPVNGSDVYSLWWGYELIVSSADLWDAESGAEKLRNLKKRARL
jgi:hypothetical protein